MALTGAYRNAAVRLLPGAERTRPARVQFAAFDPYATFGDFVISPGRLDPFFGGAPPSNVDLGRSTGTNFSGSIHRANDVQLVNANTM